MAEEALRHAVEVPRQVGSELGGPDAHLVRVVGERLRQVAIDLVGRDNVVPKADWLAVLRSSGRNSFNSALLSEATNT